MERVVYKSVSRTHLFIHWFDTKYELVGPRQANKYPLLKIIIPPSPFRRFTIRIVFSVVTFCATVSNDFLPRFPLFRKDAHFFMGTRKPFPFLWRELHELYAMHARRCTTTAACSYKSNWPDRTCAIFARFFAPLFSTVRKLEAADNEGENFVDLERGTVSETRWEENWQTKVKRDVSASMARFFLPSSWYVRACHIADFFEKMGHAKENVRNEISRVSIVCFMAKRTRLRYKTKRTKTIGKKRTALKAWQKCDSI